MFRVVGCNEDQQSNKVNNHSLFHHITLTPNPQLKITCYLNDRIQIDRLTDLIKSLNTHLNSQIGNQKTKPNKILFRKHEKSSVAFLHVKLLDVY